MNPLPPGPPRAAPPPPMPAAGRGALPPGPPNVFPRPPGPPRALIPPGPPRAALPPGPPAGAVLRQPPGPPPIVANAPPPPRPPPININVPRPPLQHANSASPLPPSGDAMLQRAAALQKTKSEGNLFVAKAVDSDDDWSVDDAESVGSSSIGKAPVVLAPGARHPSGAVIKPNIAKPPEVSKMPPPKPSSVAAVPPPRPVPATAVAAPCPAPALAAGPQAAGALPHPAAPASVVKAPPPPLESAAPPAVAPARAAPTSLANAFASVESKPTTSDAPQPLKAAVKAAKDGARVQELEEEIDEFRRKLERAEARLAQKEGSAGSLSREVALEKELDEAHEKLLSLRQDKTTLEASVRELQSRLASMDHSMDIGGASSFKSRTPFADAASSEVDSALKRSEREKELEMMLLKTKKDKDKAIRIIVQIIGKDRIAAFLNRNAGSADILDKLLEYFANNVQIGTDGANLDGTMNRSGSNSSPIKGSKSSKSGAPSSSGKSAPGRSSAGASMRSTTSAAEEYANARGKSPTRPAQFRSRMNDYFKSTMSGRDY